MNPDEEIPEVNAEPIEPGEEPDDGEEEEEEIPSLPIGPAFALISDEEAQFLPRATAEERASNPGASQGSIATLVCSCGQPFVLALVTDEPKHCPHCNKEFTSVLVVAPADDHEIMVHLLAHLQMNNEPEVVDGEAIPDGD